MKAPHECQGQPAHDRHADGAAGRVGVRARKGASKDKPVEKPEATAAVPVVQPVRAAQQYRRVFR